MDALAVRAVVLLIGCIAADCALAQRYPSQPVRIIAPAPPGSPVDIRARWVAEQLSPALGQPVLVDNKPGAGGNLGAEAAAKSPADGHTLVVVHQGIVAINPHLYERTGFDALKDFAAVTRIVDTTLMLMVPQASPVTSVSDLLRLAREKPGQLSYSSSGIGTPPHLAAELFRRMGGVAVVHIPYKGATPSMIDLLAGRVAFSIDSPASHGPHVKAGKLRALAVTSRERLAAFPEVPTMTEAGLPGYEYHGWIGLLAPAGTPAEIIRRLNAELVKALRSPVAKEWFAAQGGVAVGDSPAEFAAYIRAEYEKWGKVVREAGIKAE
jgi:tripartite-type tricarboxylate transporter receptor subunit TctC